jgi:branched-chain amino acid transport system substrate-binding protein
MVALVPPAFAQSDAPIKIGVIAEATSVAGSSNPQAAQLAADEINPAGGINGRKVQIISYDDHSTASEAVRVPTRR